MRSSYFGHTEIVELLLEANAQVDITNPSRLPSILQRVLQISLVQTNIEDNSSRESTGLFALSLASCKGNTAIVDLLLKKGASVDLQDSEGVTSLMQASYCGHIETTSSLLQNLQDKKGWPALMFAVTQNQESIAVLLARKQALINHQDAFGTSSLMLSCLFGHESMTKFLLRHDADTNLQNSEGVTALMIASSIGNKGIAELLINAGAELNTVLNTGLTALTVALSKGHTAVSELLIEFGAEEKGNAALSHLKIPTSATVLHEVYDDDKPSWQKANSLLYLIAHEWQNIGILLNLEDDVLKTIKHDNRDEAKDCLREMLKTWSNQVSTHPSWKHLKTVLEHMKQTTIANQIQIRHPSVQQPHPTKREKLPDKPTLKESFKLLYWIAHDYHNIGIQLGLQEDELKILSHYNLDPIHCLREMLSVWVRKHPPPQWDQLIKALRSTNHHIVAEKLLSIRIKTKIWLIYA